MKSLIIIFSCFFLAFSAQSQVRPPLKDPKALYNNIEAASTKIKISPTSKISELPSQSATPELNQRALKHINEPENVALILIENENIIFEGYSKGSSSSHRFASLSMAKTLVSLAIGEAYCAGHIKNLDDKSNFYAKELDGIPIGKSSIRDLLMMNSGIKINSSFHGQPYENSGTDLIFKKISIIDTIKKYGNESNSFKKFSYSNLDTEALNYVIRGATGVSLSEWLAKTVIKKSGFESESYWASDKADIEISSSFFFATLRDWARLALYIEKSRNDTNNECLSTYLKMATTKQIEANTTEYINYGYQFWVNNKNNTDENFWMVGYGGQRIGFNHSKNKIMVNFSWSHDTHKTFEFFNTWK